MGETEGESRGGIRATSAVGSVSLMDGRAWSVGRVAECDVVLDDPLVSRRHAVLRRLDGRWVLEDQGSRNGIYLDGSRAERVEVGAGVRVVFGDPALGPWLELAPEEAETPAPVPRAPATSPATLTIGRAAENDIVLDDPLVSRRHAEALREASGTWRIRDLGSHNGTFVNGRPVGDETRLEPRDIVSVGTHRLIVTESGLEPHVEALDVTLAAVGIGVSTPSGERLVSGISFAMGPASFLGVVGPSGAGKSTLLGALTGTRPAQEGAVVYEGRDLYADYADLRQSIGLVPQDDVLHTELTVRQALEYAAELRFAPDVPSDERRSRVEAVVRELGLWERRDVAIGRLSGGQRKRVSVALELLTGPSLLMLDEPTSGLDPGYERTLMELLARLAREGRTVVVVTHSVQSLGLCDRVLVLAPGGRPAYFGPPQLALAFFGCEDFQEVFVRLEAEDGAVSEERFRAHPDHERYVERPLRGLQGEGRAAERQATGRRGGWWRQLSVQTRRYARVLLGEWRTRALLVAAPLVLGALILIRLPEDQLGQPPTGQFRLVSYAPVVLFVVVICVTLVGAAGAIREIVKELPIYRRERGVGLSISAYVTSKAIVLGAIVALQSALIALVALWLQDGPRDAVLLGWPLGELMVVVAVAGFASVALALLASSLVSSTSQAMSLLSLILVGQILLAGAGVFPGIREPPGMREASYLSSARWGFAAAASTVELNRLQVVDRVAANLSTVDLLRPDQIVRAARSSGRGEPRWNHNARTWSGNMLVLLAISGACLVGTGLALRRHEKL